MDMFAVGDREEFEFVLEANRKDDAEDQVTFMLIGLQDEECEIAHKAVLSATSREIIPGMFEADGSPKVTVKIDTARNYAASKVAVKFGLVGWRNLKAKTKDGVIVDVKFPGTGKKKLRHLRPAWVQELSLAILAASGLTEDEEKN